MSVALSLSLLVGGAGSLVGSTPSLAASRSNPVDTKAFPELGLFQPGDDGSALTEELESGSDLDASKAPDEGSENSAEDVPEEEPNLLQGSKTDSDGDSATPERTNSLGHARSSQFTCDVGTVYSLERNSDGFNRVRRVNVATGDTGWAGSFPATLTNGLALSADGAQAYAVRQGNGGYTVIYRLDAGSEVASVVIPKGAGRDGVLPLEGELDIVAGGISPANGVFYFGGFKKQSIAGTDRAVFEMYGYDPATNTYLKRVARVVLTESHFQSVRYPNRWGAPIYTEDRGNGDIAFDAQGNLYIVWSNFGFFHSFGGNIIQPGQINQLVRLDSANVPTTTQPNSATVDSALLTTLPPEGRNLAYNGVTFDGSGALFVETGTVPRGTTHIKPINPNTGATLSPPGVREIKGFFGVDLASCSYPPTVSLQKNVTERSRDSDQFELKITAAENPVASARTEGSENGLQSVSAGPAIAVVGTRYQISEVAVGDTDLEKYDSSYACYWGDETLEFSSGEMAGADRTALIPEIPVNRSGQALTCTITNTPKASTSLTLQKVVENKHGGTSVISDWILTATGQTPEVAGVTGESSVTQRSVEPGAYRLSETGPFGYSGSWSCTRANTSGAASQVNIEVASGNSITLARGDNVTCTATNGDHPGSVLWQKVDNSTLPQHLSGSEWAIVGPHPSATELAVADCVAATAVGCANEEDKDHRAGQFQVLDLHWGEYTLKEVRAPAGYLLVGAEHAFQISGDALTQEFTNAFVNAPRTPPEIPFTGGLGRDFYTYLGAGVLLLGLGAASAAYLRRRRSGIA